MNESGQDSLYSDHFSLLGYFTLACRHMQLLKFNQHVLIEINFMGSCVLPYDDKQTGRSNAEFHVSGVNLFKKPFSSPGVRKGYTRLETWCM